MSAGETTIRTFEFVGGWMCLDFANTIGGLRGGFAREYLSGYGDLVAWSQQAGSITADTATHLLLEAERHPGEAAAVLESARTLREAIYGIFATLAAGTQPVEADLNVLNAELGTALAGGRIIPIAEGFGWQWPGDQHALDQICRPIARSAANLLTSPERSLVRECASAACSWLFVVNTKNHRRRWCTMTGCGNAAKVRRYRQRQHGNEEARPSYRAKTPCTADHAASAVFSTSTVPCAASAISSAISSSASG
ncbi:MAG: ABATE domain-containing protein [Ktedonobacteraceae bacterium]|nr:ABATE domain-containing protein [Ktedonobacteraceae bacterium]